MLTISDAIAKRYSKRAFLNKDVNPAILFEIITKAGRAPSGGNLQPWYVDVLIGQKLEDFLKIIETKLSANEFDVANYEVYPPKLWDPYRARRFEVGEALYDLLGVARDDKAGRYRQFCENFRFFGAPVGIFFSIDKRMNKPQWADLGMYMQSLMLLAVENGLVTCSQEAWVVFNKTIGKFLGYDENRDFFCGMALGYEDESAPINKLKPNRATLNEFAKFHF